jgi:hypothetical protein
MQGRRRKLLKKDECTFYLCEIMIKLSLALKVGLDAQAHTASLAAETGISEGCEKQVGAPRLSLHRHGPVCYCPDRDNVIEGIVCFGHILEFHCFATVEQKFKN